MNIPTEEIKRIRKTLLINLVAADVVLTLGIIIYLLGKHKFEMYGFFLMILGIIWIVMTVTKMIKFKRFTSGNSHQKS